MTNKQAKTSFKPIVVVMLASLAIAALWDKIPAIKNSIHFILDPSAGALLDWNMTIGMLIIVLVISFLTTLIQKHATDQETLKDLKKQQKEIQKEIKQSKNNPKKMMELQKKQMSFLPQQFKLGMRSIVYTGVPLILFFRWFDDYFSSVALVTGEPVKFFGFLGWFLFYLVFTVIFSSIIKKWMDVV